MYILENYWAVCFGVAPYIDRETHIFPKCTNNRGLHMVSLQHNMSRTEFIPFWGHVEAGTHLDLTCPFMDHQKVHRAEVKKIVVRGDQLFDPLSDIGRFSACSDPFDPLAIKNGSNLFQAESAHLQKYHIDPPSICHFDPVSMIF